MNKLQKRLLAIQLIVVMAFTAPGIPIVYASPNDTARKAIYVNIIRNTLQIADIRK